MGASRFCNVFFRVTFYVFYEVIAPLLALTSPIYFCSPFHWGGHPRTQYLVLRRSTAFAQAVHRFEHLGRGFGSNRRRSLRSRGSCFQPPAPSVRAAHSHP